jgi:hypothetical protein
VSGWSIPLPDASEWRPEQRDVHREPMAEIEPGAIVLYERKPYRVATATMDDPLNWPESTREKWIEDGAPDPATWHRRPYTVSVHPVEEPDAKPLWLGASARSWWYVAPEHYSICRLCREIPPCAHAHAAKVMEDAAGKMGQVLSILPGCCHCCGNPVTRREKTILFEGPNLIRPDLGDDSALFHLRQSCNWAAYRYDVRWAAAVEGRRRKLYCAGRRRDHYDGTWDCTLGAECTGDVQHESSEWHQPGRGLTAGCWCVSGDLTARIEQQMRDGER